MKRNINHKRIIGIGSRRVVYNQNNGYVLKKARSKSGVRSNFREVKIFKFAPAKVKKHLGYIHKYGGGFGWLVMKRYPLQFKKTRKNMRKLFALKAKFRRCGLVPYEVTTNRGRPNFNNIRQKTNGVIVIIDYGNFRFD